ncbi:hypothetical protein JY651_14475 [Pyxidicoccus parkwayensis]|uniref:Uncharacterized protein n=1 Tax=Pyxidicoccus parkwayensis TaxID=2813578 RepID=A0ABX7P6D6_9BACT|nr:hypothetical protein [Pyxidicoccus parkwaysis]QSQ26050.1 hypothetical protein JY651_14475 [Pyxidicoccus parkwaysis]
MATRKTTKTRAGSGTGTTEKAPTRTPATKATTRTTPTEPQAELAATIATSPLATATDTKATATTTPTRTATYNANLAGAIEVGSKAAEMVIVRDGVEITAPQLNLSRVDAYVERLKPVVAFSTPRVVQQSVKPGTRVAKGTVVDLVLVPPTNIELGLVDKAHVGFQHRTVDQVAPYVEQARSILERRATAADLTDNERAQMYGILQQADIVLNDADPTTSLDAAYRVLQGAKAYS